MLVTTMPPPDGPHPLHLCFSTTQVVATGTPYPLLYLTVAESTGRGSPESCPLGQQVAWGIETPPGSPEAEASARPYSPTSHL